MTDIIDFSEQKALYLGQVDEGAWVRFKRQRNAYFQHYHYYFWKRWSPGNRENKFRGEAPREWIAPTRIRGNHVSRLQAFLQRHGFMPFGEIDGVFGYKTLASVRLFQEYVRTVEEFDIGLTDGRVGEKTHRHMLRWKRKGLYSEWGPTVDPHRSFAYPVSRASEEYLHWLDLLQRTTEDYARQLALADRKTFEKDVNLRKLRELSDYPRVTDSLPVSRWQFHSSDIHLIGLRPDPRIPGKVRGNDDLFVLLMNGLVFKFRGSTGPRPGQNPNAGIQGNEPYLSEGQHLYRLGWYKQGNLDEVSRALKPDSIGVLVHRDWDPTESLADTVIRVGLKQNPDGLPRLENPNPEVKIHWSGDGNEKGSSGCHAISGKSYINHQGKLVDCSGFCASGRKAPDPISRPGVKTTRGAYNFLLDFVLAYGGSRDKVRYTLVRDGILDLFGDDRLIDNLATPEIVRKIRMEEGRGKQLKKLMELMGNPCLT